MLKRAREIMGQKVITYVMNPKSMPRSQLLGLMNNEIREFTDGNLIFFITILLFNIFYYNFII